MTSPPLTSRSGSPPLNQVHETTMEDLAKFLQDTRRTIEGILDRHNSASVKAPRPEVSDVRTSLSIGMPAVTRSMLPTSIGHALPAEPHHFLHRDVVVGGFTSSPFQNDVGKASHHHHESTSFGPVQHWFTQQQPEKSSHGRPMLETEPLAFDKAEGNLLDEDALRAFLEEIQKTIRDWSARHEVLLHGKATNTAMVTRDVTHGAAVGSSAIFLPMGPPPPQSHQKDQSVALRTQPLVETNPREKEVSDGSHHHIEKAIGEGACGVVPHQGEEAGDCLFQAEQVKSLGEAPLDQVVEHIASQLLQSDDEEPHSQQTPHVQDPSEKEEAAQMSPSAKHKGELGFLQRNPQAANQHEEVNEGVTTTLKDITVVVDSFVTPIKADQTEPTLPLTKWTPPPLAAAKDHENLASEMKTQPYRRPVEVVTSPDWLPEGWVTELKTRGSGNSAGSKDKYYVDPVSKRRFRSRKEVFYFLETGKLNRYRKRSDTSPIRKLIGLDLSPSPPKRTNKKAKTKQNSTPSTSAPPPPMVPSIAAPAGLLGNMFMPFRTGQPPSEWLVYESLASLPFPMFDPFRYADFSANKSSGSSKGQHLPTRPWFFTGPEASWRPFMERTSLGKPGDKGRDYHGLFSVPPTYAPEAAPKQSAGSGRKSSKRNSTGAM